MSSPEPSPIDLHSRGIDDMQAADLRTRFATFTEDWDSPEMNQYDDYDSATIALKSAEDTFRQGWLEAQSGQTRPVSELWDGIDAIRKRSQLTDAQAAELAAEIDQAVWNDLRQTFPGG